MEIQRTVDGKEYAFELSPEELLMAYNEMKDTYMRLNIDNMLEETETLTFGGQDRQAAESLSTALFKGSERFYNDIIFRKEKMDFHVENFQYAMEDVLSGNGSDYIKLIIEERFADTDLFFLDPSGDIRWITYNPDSSAGGQFIDITFSQNTLRQAYASEEKIDEYILSRCSASIIDADKVGFIEYADCIAQKSPDWNDFGSFVNDIMPDIKKNIKAPLPTITCNYSDSPVFENKKTYSIYEFDKLMKQAKEEFIARKWSDYETSIYKDEDFKDYLRHTGYDKIKFTINMPDGTKITEHHDVGDCFNGGIIDWLKFHKYTDIASQLEKVCEMPETVRALEETALASINQVSAEQTSLERYTLRADEDKYGGIVYAGYKDGKQDTDAEKNFSDLLKHNPEYAKKQIIDNSLKKGFIGDVDYADASFIVMSAKEKTAHIDAVEMAMRQNGPCISKADDLLYKQLILEKIDNIEWIPGMQISQQLYDEIHREYHPYLHIDLKNGCGFQTDGFLFYQTSPEYNPGTGALEPTYMTFVNVSDKYFYAGMNFAKEVNQEQYANIMNQINAAQSQQKSPVIYKAKGRR